MNPRLLMMDAVNKVNVKGSSTIVVVTIDKNK